MTSTTNKNWNNEVAIVSGASAGIGASVALNLANLGMTVIGLARRNKLIDALNEQVTGGGPGKIIGRKCDVTNENDIDETFKWIKENFSSIKIFVNNAGINKANFLIESPYDDFKNLFDVNVIASCNCIKNVVRLMREQNVKGGHIFVINSVLGHRIVEVPVPLFNVYPATKHAITALCQTTRAEFMFFKLDIKLTSINPGMVDTDFLKCYQSTEMFPKLKPDGVAKAVVYAMNTPDYVQVWFN
ncbi:DHRS11.2 family protein [Megaselia abdita]